MYLCLYILVIFGLNVCIGACIDVPYVFIKCFNACCTPRSSLDGQKEVVPIFCSV